MALEGRPGGVQALRALAGPSAHLYLVPPSSSMPGPTRAPPPSCVRQAQWDCSSWSRRWSDTAGRWVGSTRYSTLPVYPNPGYPPAAHPWHAPPETPNTRAYCTLGPAQGDPRGGIRTVHWGRAIPPPRALLAAPHCPCSTAPGAYSELYLSISQYISVLGIS